MNFMRGRYGNDQFGIFLFIVSFVLEIIGMLVKIRFIYWIGIIVFVFMFARVFSRNIYKRQAENEKFLNVKNRIMNWNYFRKQKKKGTYTYSSSERAKNGKGREPVYCYFYCPACKQQVRVPAGKGKVKVTCPKCGTVFEMVS
ncbi:MAG: hypothetical protein VB031_00435 [Eubacteriaceae bacterium]|nr:hypothetical protein [Eubacteriaceae bacterium]